MIWSNMISQWAFVGTTWDGFGPLDFPPSPSNGDTYRNYVYDSGIGAWRASESINFADISDLNITVLNDKDIIIYDEPSAKWVDIPNPVPVGGSTGQVLTKSSGTSYDTEWSTLPEPGINTGKAIAMAIVFG